MRPATVLLSLLIGVLPTLAPAEALLTSEETSTALNTAVGATLSLRSLPLSKDADGAVTLDRIEIYAPRGAYPAGRRNRNARDPAQQLATLHRRQIDPRGSAHRAIDRR